MDKKRQKSLIFLFLIAAEFPVGQLSEEIHYLEVNKCCPKGSYMNIDGNCMSTINVEQTENETFSPPMDPEKVSWLPYSLRSRHIHVRYWTYRRVSKRIIIDKDESIVEKFLSINNTARNFFLDPFGPEVTRNTVLRQSYCFEGTDDPFNPFIIRTRVASKFIAKCCKKGEEFNSVLNCVTKSGFTSENVLLERNLNRQGNESYWLPRVINESVHVLYDIAAKSPWNTFTSANNLTTWKLVEGDLGYVVQFTNPPIPVGTEVNTVGQAYCFDSTNNPNMSHVILGLVINAYKCCKLGEHIDFKNRKCVQRDGYNIEDNHFGVETPATSYWLPSTFGNKSIPVFYNLLGNTKTGIHYVNMFRAEEYNLVIRAPPGEKPRLYLGVRSLSGRTGFVSVENHCFDSITKSPFAPILLMEFSGSCDGFKCVPKCCPRYQVLTKSGRCEQHPSASWHPHNSSISAFLDHDEIYGVKYQFLPFCESHYQVTEFEPKQAAKLLTTNPYGQASFSTLTRTFYCADFLQVGDELQETVASCEWPPSGRTYAVVHHFSIISIVLLLVAIVAILTQEHTRNSAHGQAMASHAFSLLATNTLTYAFLYNEALKYCIIYTLPIYFFLLAAGFWLNVVSINITLGFREPPGQKSIPHGRRQKYVRLALAHAYGWGTPAVLTAFAGTMNFYKDAEWTKNLYKPSFAEARTCFYEVDRSSLNIAAYSSDLEIASWMYYYGPMAVLVIINSICLVLTVLKIRSLSKDSAFLQNASAGGTKKKAASQTLANTLLYLKLLLFTGTIELITDGTIWATRKRRFEIPHITAFYAVEVVLIYRISAVILDLIRACAVCWLGVGRINHGWIQILRRGELCLTKNILKLRKLKARERWSPKNSSTDVNDEAGFSLKLKGKVMGTSFTELSE